MTRSSRKTGGVMDSVDTLLGKRGKGADIDFFWGEFQSEMARTVVERFDNFGVT